MNPSNALAAILATLPMTACGGGEGNAPEAVQTTPVTNTSPSADPQSSRPASQPASRPVSPPLEELPEGAVELPSGLAYVVLQKGEEGPSPSMGDKVTVHYTGTLTNGTKFDSSHDRGQPAQFQLGQVIQGWNEGLALMTKGAKYQLICPPELAYGAQGRPPVIPANATLLFDVELIDFVASPKMRPSDPEKQKTTESGLKWEPIVEGTGGNPTETDMIELEYAIWTPNGDLLDWSGNNGPYRGGMSGLRLPFMQEAIKMLKVGSRYRYEVSAQLGNGQPTIWEMELLSFEKVELPEFVLPTADELTTTESGLQYMVVEEGTGQQPQQASNVTVHYAGWLTDGTLFDASYQRGEPASFPVMGVIDGWKEGLQLMKVGASYRFVIPGKLAYGERGSPPNIGPNATLVFFVKLLESKP